MATERYLLETSAVDGYLLEQGGGVLLLENQPALPGGEETFVFFSPLLDGLGSGGIFRGNRPL